MGIKEESLSCNIHTMYCVRKIFVANINPHNYSNITATALRPNALERGVSQDEWTRNQRTKTFWRLCIAPLLYRTVQLASIMLEGRQLNK